MRKSAPIATSMAVGIFVAVFLYLLFRFRSSGSRNKEPKVFAFFHPYASGGGGGERVLWKTIQFLQTHFSQRRDIDIVIYTLDSPSTNEQDLRRDVEKRFDVRIPHAVRLVSLEEYKDYLSPSPYLSLMLESYGTMRLARKALLALKPDVFCDTTGCAFTFAVVRWMCPQAWILAYVHYPTISTDMMLWEWQQHGAKVNSVGENNKASWARRLRTIVKMGYYWFFALLYGLVGSMADLVMVNSTWTYNHISSLWRFCHHPIQIVYPPCRVPDTFDDSLTVARTRTIISIGQFRPEKDHKLQIEALSILFKIHPELKKQADGKEMSSISCSSSVQLLLIGSCRNEADQARVNELRELVSQMGLLDSVVFNINPSYKELQNSIKRASVGIHTMRQEHFGIGIVEMMASGCLVIAHNSGGPKTDIVIPGKTGFLARTPEEYANAIYQALTMNEEHQRIMRREAQKSSERFSDHAFDTSLEKVFPLLTR